MDALTVLLDRVAEVCPLPATARKILSLCQSDDVDIPELARVTATDPALAAAVLRIANSAAFGGRGIDQLDVALLRIGLRELRDMAAAMSLLATFRSQAELSLRLHDRSVVSGSIASQLAKDSKATAPGTAFTCGLLSEIGAMACLAAEGKSYVQVWSEAAGSELARSELERAQFGFTSLQVGRAFLERNGLPSAVYEAVGTALDENVADAGPLAKITVLARHATAHVLAKHASQGSANLQRELEALTHVVPFADFTGKRLLDLCVQASASAEQALRRAR